jgi:hypothetical protein
VLSYGEGDAQSGRTSSFSLVAAEDGTTATITLPVDVGPRAANVPYSINLNAGQVYELAADRRRRSDRHADRGRPADWRLRRPSGGSGARRLQRGQSPGGTVAAGGHLGPALPHRAAGHAERRRPVSGAGRAGRDRDPRGPGAGRDAEPRPVLRDRARQPAEIAASEPVLVAQFAHGTTYDSVLGDPTLLLVPPVEQFLDHYTLATPLTGFDVNYLNIVAPRRPSARSRWTAP